MKEKTGTYLVMGITGHVGGGARGSCCSKANRCEHWCAIARKWQLGTTRRGAGGWRLERCRSHSDGAQGCSGRVDYVAVGTGALA